MLKVLPHPLQVRLIFAVSRTCGCEAVSAAGFPENQFLILSISFMSLSSAGFC